MESTNVQSQEPPRGVTFEEVWAFMQETFRQLKEMGTETDRRIKETQRIVGGLGNRFGDMAEQFLIPALQGKFMDIGFSFEEISRNVVWKNESHGFLIELDALLKNDTQAMVVEVKAKLDKTDIDEQIGRMEKVRQYANLHGDTRQYYCAIATMAAKETVIAYALSMGFYLIMPSGEDVKVTKPTSKPRVW